MADVERYFGDSSIRFIDDGDRKWINANDCASILEYANPRDAVSKFIDSNRELLEGFVCKFHTQGKSGSKIQWYFSEHGLIAFIIRSGQPKALPFQRWAIDQLHRSIKQTERMAEKSLRVKSKRVRCDFTDTLKNHGVSKPHEFIQLTYQTKQGLGIDRNKKKNDLNLMELCQVAMTELLSTYEIEARELSGYYSIKPAVAKSSESVKSLPLTTVEEALT